MLFTQTHTYATLEVSQKTYDEVHKLLKEAKYDHAFTPEGLIDMYGIALKAPGKPKKTKSSVIKLLRKAREHAKKLKFRTQSVDYDKDLIR